MTMQAKWTIRADAHATAVLELEEHDGVPVIFKTTGRYPTAVRGEQTTRTAPCVEVSIACSTRTDGAGVTTREWTGATVTALGDYTRAHSHRRCLTVLVTQGRSLDALMSEARAAVPGALDQLARIDATFEAAHARIAQADEYPPELSRREYEQACRTLGIEALGDDKKTGCECYGVLYGSFTFPEYSADHCLGMALAFRRLRGIRAERAAIEKAVPKRARAPEPRAWGASGTRYDERCDGCRRVQTVDNSTGLCRRCAG